MNDSDSPARELIAQLRSRLATVVLGTAGPDAEPEASVAASLLDASGAFVIYVSGLAAHTRHLRANPRASVLLAEDDTGARTAFARRRLSFACTAQPVARDSAAHASLAAAFREKFGATLDLLAGLPDFQFIRLVPQRGRVVAGFGAAFEVDPDGWHRDDTLKLSPVRPRG